MRVLIVDDEAAARRRLSIMLDDLDVEVVGEAENGVQALELVVERRPDVLMLDISMPEVDGFDVARHLPDPKPLIVFQTAYDEHALEAFEHEAVDYLVKPVSRRKLERALDRVRERLGDGGAGGSSAGISSAVLRQLRSAVAPSLAATTPRVLVRERGGHRLVPYREIVLFAAAEGVVYAHTEESSISRTTPFASSKSARRARSCASTARSWSTWSASSASRATATVLQRSAWAAAMTCGLLGDERRTSGERCRAEPAENSQL